MIKAICFDVGGTLIRSSGMTFSQRLSASIGKPITLIREKVVKHFYLQEQTFEKALYDFCREVEVPFSNHLVEEILGVRLVPAVFKDTIHCLSKLKEFKLATISNCTPWEFTNWGEVGMENIFEIEIRSFEVGLSKPNPEIFSRVEKTLDLEPTEILMVGDSCRDDIAGAKARGWKAVHIIRGGDSPCLIADHAIDSLNHLKDIIDRYNHTNFEGR